MPRLFICCAVYCRGYLPLRRFSEQRLGLDGIVCNQINQRLQLAGICLLQGLVIFPSFLVSDICHGKPIFSEDEIDHQPAGPSVAVPKGMYRLKNMMDIGGHGNGMVSLLVAAMP